MSAGISYVLDHLPPAAVEAEEAVLGSCLSDPDAINRVRADLRPADFFRDRNRAIYETMLDLGKSSEPVDFLTVCEALRRGGIYDEVGGLAYLSHLTGVVPTAVHAASYGKLVRDAALRRRIIGAAGRIAGLAHEETGDVDALLPSALKLLSDTDGNAAPGELLYPEDQAQLLHDMVGEILVGDTPRVPTGLIDLDRMMAGGLEPDMLAVLMALPGMGKSAAAQSILRNMAAKGYVALFVSVEMSKRQLVRRNAASMMSMDWHLFEAKVRAGDKGAVASLESAAERMERSKMVLWHRPSTTTQDIRAKALEVRGHMGRLDCIVVDYLQLLADEIGENRTAQVGRACRQLKRLAGELQVPVIVLSQMNRDYKDRTNKRPTYSDARDSGEIEQHADTIWGLYRDDFFYEPGEVIDQKRQIKCEAGKAELLVLKQREGPTGTCYLTWRASTCEYVSYAKSRI